MASMKAPCGNRLTLLLQTKMLRLAYASQQSDFYNCYVFIKIHKSVHSVSKHLRHFIRSNKVLGWKPFTVGEVFVNIAIAIPDIGPDLLQFSFQVSMMV